MIFDGDGAFRLFDVMGADYNIFDGLTIRNTEVAFWAGVKDVAGAKGLTVRNCRIENVGVGVNTQFAGSKDFYIADNVFLGRDDRHRVLGWANPGLYGAHPINSYYAIKVYGSGHVIAHNAVAFFHDGISVCTHGVPEPEQDLRRSRSTSTTTTSTSPATTSSKPTAACTTSASCATAASTRRTRRSARSRSSAGPRTTSATSSTTRRSRSSSAIRPA